MRRVGVLGIRSGHGSAPAAMAVMRELAARPLAVLRAGRSHRAWISSSTSAPPSSLACLLPLRTVAAVRLAGAQPRRFLATIRREQVIDAETVNPGSSSTSSSSSSASSSSSSSPPPRSDLSQKEIDDQFDKVYEKLYNRKRPRGGGGGGGGGGPVNPFTQPWQERLFDVVFSNAGSFIMLTVLASLFLQISREQGEHKEYKRVTTARLQDAQHALELQQTLVHRAADAKREEVQRALEEAAAMGKVAMSPEEVRTYVDQVLTSLVAEVDATLAPVNSSNTTPVENAEPSSTQPATTVAAAPAVTPSGAGEGKGYHKVV